MNHFLAEMLSPLAVLPDEQRRRVLHLVLTALALLISFAIYQRTRRRLELTGDQKRFLSFAALAGAFIGAKLPFALVGDVNALFSWNHWLSDGKTVLGGILGGYLSVEWMKMRLGIRQSTGDAFAIPIAAGLSIGRLGCFFGGCCFGAPTELPWGVLFPTAPDCGVLHRHPTQIYETLFHAAAVCILIVCQSRGWLPGMRLQLYLLAYLTYRFLTEWIRPEPIYILGLTAYQVACIGLAGLLLVQLSAKMMPNLFKGSGPTIR